MKQVLVCFMLNSLVMAQEHQQADYKQIDVTEVAIEADNADVTIEGCEEELLRLDTNKSALPQYCAFDVIHDKEAKKLTSIVRASKPLALGDAPCQLKLGLMVAPGTALNLKMGAGDVKAKGLRGGCAP